MNNKGYMLYELIIGFALAIIISVFLLNTAFKLNDKNEELIISSKMSVIQEDYTSRFYSDVDSHVSVYFTGELEDNTGAYCSFKMYNYKAVETDKEDFEIIRFGIDKVNNTIYYGVEGDEYETELPKGIVAKNIYCNHTYDSSVIGYGMSIFKPIKVGNKNSAIVIRVEMEDKYLNKNYDINIMYLFQDVDSNLQYQS